MSTQQIILTLLISIVWAIAIHAIIRVIRSYRSKKKSLTYREMSDLLNFHREKAIELDNKLKDIDSEKEQWHFPWGNYPPTEEQKEIMERTKAKHKAQDPSRPDSQNDLLSPSIQENIIKKFQEKEPIEIKSASIDHVSIGLNGIELGISNIEYKDDKADFIESRIESNTSDTCSDNSSVDFGGGDSGGSGSGNDF